MMKKIIFFLVFKLSLGSLSAQTYYVYDDSVFFSIRIEASKKDSIEKLHFKIKNNSSTNLFICKRSSRSIVYINTLDGPLIIGCGCEYGFNQDYSGTDENDVIMVGKNDSLIFEMGANVLKQKPSRKMTLKEFKGKDKLFKIDYVLSNNSLLFLNKKNIYENFIKNKKRLAFFIPRSL